LTVSLIEELTNRGIEELTVSEIDGLKDLVIHELANIRTPQTFRGYTLSSRSAMLAYARQA